MAYTQRSPQTNTGTHVFLALWIRISYEIFSFWKDEGMLDVVAVLQNATHQCIKMPYFRMQIYSFSFFDKWQRGVLAALMKILKGKGLGGKRRARPSSFASIEAKRSAWAIWSVPRLLLPLLLPFSVLLLYFFSYPSAGQTSNHTRTLTHISNNNSKKLTRKCISFASILRAGILI